MMSFILFICTKNIFVTQDCGENIDETFSDIGTAFKNIGNFL